MRKITYFLLFLLLTSFVCAEQIKVRLEATASSYQVNDLIPVKVYLESKDLAYPFNIVGGEIYIRASDDNSIKYLDVSRDSNGNIFGSENVDVNFIPDNQVVATGGARIQISGPAVLADVSATKTYLATFKVPAKAATANLQFTVTAQSRIADGNDDSYTFESVPTGIITIGGETPLPPCTDADWEAVSGLCSVVCGIGTQIVNYQHPTSCTGTRTPTTQACSPTCADGLTCTENQCVDSTPVSTCGNDVINTGENCLTCPADAPCPTGQTCNAQGECVTPVQTPVCGNSIVETAEQCDGGTQACPGQTGTQTCTAQCTWSSCPSTCASNQDCGTVDCLNGECSGILDLIRGILNDPNKGTMTKIGGVASALKLYFSS